MPETTPTEADAPRTYEKLSDETIAKLRRWQNDALEYGRREALSWISPALAFAGLAFDVGLLAELERLRAVVDLARRWSPLSASPCPFCDYRDGVYHGPCGYHAELERLRSTIDALHGAACELEGENARLQDVNLGLQRRAYRAEANLSGDSSAYDDGAVASEAFGVGEGVATT